MNSNTPLVRLFVRALLLCACAAASCLAAELPRLEKRGQAVQLVVDGRPYLILGGEVSNTASSSIEYMDSVWPKLVQLRLNTVLVAVAWDWVEPEEGRYDFGLVDGLLAGARKHDLRLVFLWFGSWKNGISSFAPAWVKRDQARFPRMQISGGRSVEVLSTLSRENREADGKAYAAFMRHLREVDSERRTVLMIQMQNEVGLLGDSRDRSAAAEAAFAGAVPRAVLERLKNDPVAAGGELHRLWVQRGAKTAGSWSEVFGDSRETDELFMAWTYADYLEDLTKAGKVEYALPAFTNTWIVQPEDKGPGDYPSGGPKPLTFDIWKAAAPSIDLNAPDVYLPNFDDWAALYRRSDNPLFIPESRGDAGGAANAFYAIGRHAALGYSPFGIDNTGRLLASRPEPDAEKPVDLASLPLAKAYGALRELTPSILEAQSLGSISAAWLNPAAPSSEFRLGGYVVNVDLRRNRRNPASLPSLGYALVIQTAPDEYLVAGQDVQVTFRPCTPGPEISGLARVELGNFVEGRWVVKRLLNGDDVLLDYDLAGAAGRFQSGSGLRFGPEGPSIQRAKLYRYR